MQDASCMMLDLRDELLHVARKRRRKEDDPLFGVS
jgi:hypothetical protein